MKISIFEDAICGPDVGVNIDLESDSRFEGMDVSGAILDNTLLIIDLTSAQARDIGLKFLRAADAAEASKKLLDEYEKGMLASDQDEG